MTTTGDVVERIQVAPDAGLVKSLGANHSLASALADLVDNSIDAGASRVVIRLLTQDERLSRVEVVDNGRGMDAADANKAMTIGHQRDYGESDLGHFGMGLKAASFGHADVLTVWSQKYGATPVGRRIRRADFSRDFSCEVLSSDAADIAARDRGAVVPGATGTSVIWTGLRGAYRGSSPMEARFWLDTVKSELQTHLGVVFHRLIGAKRIVIELLVDEADAGEAGIGVPVTAIDPFAYKHSGRPGYPKTLKARSGGEAVALTCHIWPAKSDRSGFRLGKSTGENFQGFFIYRNDRLLQVGGWSGTANQSTARQLARVVLDDAEAIGKFVTMNSEKQGLKFEPVFLDAVSHAKAADGTTFDDFLLDAESTYKESQKRSRARKPAIQPDKGFAPALRRRVENELPMIVGDSMKVSWRRLPEGEFLDFDLGERTVYLNSYYRPIFAPQGSSLNDAPVIKALVYLLAHHVFEGQYLGPKDKDQIALWKSVLGAAVVAEERMQGFE